MNTSDPGAVFVTGFPKSGTTLLLSLLDGHPELCVFPKESEFFTVARREIENDRKLGLKRFVYRSIKAPQFGMKDSIDLPISTDQYLLALNTRWESYNFDISGFLKSAVLAYGDMVGQTQRKWWVEKTPLTELYADDLSKWYPKMKMIYIVRDPRANFSTLKKWKSSVQQTISTSRFAFEWSRSIDSNTRNRKHLEILTIRYEDLINKPKMYMTKVSRFLDIAYDDCLQVPTINGHSFEGNSAFGDKFQGVSTRSQERWKEELSGDEICLIEDLVHDQMNMYGYPKMPALSTDGVKASLFWRIQLNRRKKDFYFLYNSLPRFIKQSIKCARKCFRI